MYVTINEIIGAHHNVEDGSVRVTCMHRGFDHDVHLYLTITPTDLRVSLVPGDWSQGLVIDLATVKVECDLIDATRRLFGMVGKA